METPMESDMEMEMLRVPARWSTAWSSELPRPRWSLLVHTRSLPAPPLNSLFVACGMCLCCVVYV